MPVYRVDKQSNYTKVGNYFIRDPDLSLRGKGMLTLLLSLPEDWRHSVSGLAAVSKEGEAAVRSALNELERLGYLERRRRRDGQGRLHETEYSIYEQPKDTFDLCTGTPYSDKPTSEKPTAGIPVLESPVEEKSGQLITDYTNN